MTNNLPTPATLKVVICFNPYAHDEPLLAWADLRNGETLEEIAAAPKMIGLKAKRLSHHDGTTTRWENFGGFRVTLVANGVNGGRNETGIKRLLRLLAYAKTCGWAVEYDNGYANSYQTLEGALAAIAG